jgi:trans-aconitate 2-methyltransferase
VTDWSGRDYAEVSGLQRTMAKETIATLSFAQPDRVLDVGCGDGFITQEIAKMVPDGYAVGLDASPRMIAAANQHDTTDAGPWFVVADARRIPFCESFDVAVSFNALHWVPHQRDALGAISAALRPGGRAVIQVVCAGPRASLEATAMDVCQSPRWASYFNGYQAPFVHVDPDEYRTLAASARLTLDELTVTDREWDFGSREAFTRWCAVGSTAWTDRLPADQRDAFVDDEVRAYEPIAGRQGLFRFTQMRAVLIREERT